MQKNSDNKSTTDSISKTILSKKEYKILPIDESNSDQSLVNFISELKTIVNNKGKVELLKCLDTAIIVSYGGGISGISEFSKKWKLDQPSKSKIWETLKQILEMGGTWEKDEDGEKCFRIPYAQSNKAFAKFKYDFDWFLTAVCIKPQVKVYNKPKTTSTVIATLSYDIVEMDPDFMKDDFTKVHTIDKKIKVYVKTGDLLYSSDAPLILKKVNGNWKITAFAPFD